ncbi:U-box domain-containing protein 33-like isoform X1 [Canna indica]|uniref:RING-type E3 ubiquitin transferase n=1 Tax=Canna indica TaxID=4628 RepID=A0AAQ3KKA8_9LILI|nr:U-box domain-containing protein 33-like isoform X1 [Canna indica]
MEASWELGRTSSSQSYGSHFSSEIGEELVGMPASATEDKVYVAVAANFKAGKATLSWAIKNNPNAKAVVLVHVHTPAQMIPLMGGKFPATVLRSEQVSAYRQSERAKMNKKLEEYLAVCSHLKVSTEKLVIESDVVAKGLVKLIQEFGIPKLVMGAASDKHYSKKMKDLKSKTAIHVKQHADPSCIIWFVCKGKLIYTREASLHVSQIDSSPSTNQISTSSQSEQLRPGSATSRKNESFNLLQNPLEDHSWHMSADYPLMAIQESRLSIPVNLTDIWDDTSSISQRSGHLSASNNNGLSNSESIELPNYMDSDFMSASLSSVHDYEGNLQYSSPQHELVYDDRTDSDADLFGKLRVALEEVDHLKHETYQESCKRGKAERQLLLSLQKIKDFEDLYAKEVRYRKEIEGELDRKKLEVERHNNQQAEALHREKMEVEKLRNQLAEVSRQLKIESEQKLGIEAKLAESICFTKDLEEKLSQTHNLVHSLQEKYDTLQKELEDAVKEAEEMRHYTEQTNAGSSLPLNSEFSYLELEQATQNFSSSLKIGEGGFGKVYKGCLRNTTVAIKMLNTKGMQGQPEFHQEVAVLSRVRHPNLVTLIGACSDAFALIYEFLPNGSLEDWLAFQNSSHLTWQQRTRIIAEICSALIFLHSNRPHPVVHGDLKPDNILLDANLVSKLSDFGICRFLVESNTSTTLHRKTNPKGTFAYIDPEFLTTGEITPQSDIYSFGIIILRLVTGKPALGIAREVQESLDKGYFHNIIDRSAGEWPFFQAKQLVHLGLRCSEMSRKNRPNLVTDAWKVVEPMVKAGSLSFSSLSLKPSSDDKNHIPSYFICPIFQEIMNDPHVAADGFTYEAEAIKGWIDGGHDTSPMTNLKLENCELIPNRAIRSAIQEWLQLHQS